VAKNRNNEAGSNLKESTVHVGRTAKVVKGGRRFGFSAIVVVGDGNGTVGVGLGKAAEVSIAVTKATDAAKKSMIRVNVFEGKIPHEVLGKFGAGKVLLKPALDWAVWILPIVLNILEEGTKSGTYLRGNTFVSYKT